MVVSDPLQDRYRFLQTPQLNQAMAEVVQNPFFIGAEQQTLSVQLFRFAMPTLSRILIGFAETIIKRKITHFAAASFQRYGTGGGKWPTAH